MTIRRLYAQSVVAAALLLLAGLKPASAQTMSGRDFNAYILRAVEILNRDYAARGYAQAAYTHELDYGPAPGTRIRPSKPPYTMCVAAVAEVIITALNLYMQDHRNDPAAGRLVLDYLPPEGWMRMRPRDIRSHIWVDSHLKSYGTADALSTFGVGRHAKFGELKPGAFVNVNRLNNSGHAVVFLGYVDAQGRDVLSYGPTVAGFRYFSSQGKAYSPESGFGYRWAFFNRNGAKFCPHLNGGRKIDCGIIPRPDQNNLNTGYMLMPQFWDAAYRDQSLWRISDRLYQQDYSRGPASLSLPANLTRDQFGRALDKTDTMQLNPRYTNQDMPDD